MSELLADDWEAHLLAALNSDDIAEKNFHIRQVLQAGGRQYIHG